MHADLPAECEEVNTVYRLRMHGNVTDDVNVNALHPLTASSLMLVCSLIKPCGSAGWVIQSVSKPVPLGSSRRPFGYWMPGYLNSQCCNGAITQTVPAECLLLAHQWQEARVSHRLCTRSHHGGSSRQRLHYDDFLILVIAYLDGFPASTRRSMLWWGSRLRACRNDHPAEPQNHLYCISFNLHST